MTSGPLPRAVERLLAESIPTAAHMEALLYLRAREGESVDVAGVATSIFAHVRVTGAILDDLCASGLIRRVQGRNEFRYALLSDERRRVVDALATLHRTNLVAVLQCIHEQAARRGPT